MHVAVLQVCQLAAAAEAASEHPLARAVLEFAEAELSKAGADKTPAPAGPLVNGLVHTNGLKQPANPHNVVAMYSLDDDNSSRSSSSSRSSPFAEAEAYEQRRRSNKLSQQHRSNNSSAGSLTNGDRDGWPSSPNGLSSRRGKHTAGALVYGKGGSGVWVGKGSGADPLSSGSPINTPTRLKMILASGMLKVSDVQVRLGMGGRLAAPGSVGSGRAGEKAYIRHCLFDDHCVKKCY